jgi:hypothetical protein
MAAAVVSAPTGGLSAGQGAARGDRGRAWREPAQALAAIQIRVIWGRPDQPHRSL